MGMQVVKEMDGLRREMRRQERRITSMENERKQNEFIVEALKEEKRSLIIKLRRAVTGQDPILEIENTPPPPPPLLPPPPPPPLPVFPPWNSSADKYAVFLVLCICVFDLSARNNTRPNIPRHEYI